MKFNSISFVALVACALMLGGCASNGTYYRTDGQTTTEEFSAPDEEGNQYVTKRTVDNNSEDIRNQARSSVGHNQKAANRTDIIIDGWGTFHAGGEADQEGQAAQIAGSLGAAAGQLGKSDMQAFMEYLTALENAKAREVSEEGGEE